MVAGDGGAERAELESVCVEVIINCLVCGSWELRIEKE